MVADHLKKELTDIENVLYFYQMSMLSSNVKKMSHYTLCVTIKFLLDDLRNEYSSLRKAVQYILDNKDLEADK